MFGADLDADLAEINRDCGSWCTIKHGQKTCRVIAAISPETRTDAGFLAVDAGAASASLTVRTASIHFVPAVGDFVYTDRNEYRVVDVAMQDGDAAFNLSLVMEGRES